MPPHASVDPQPHLGLVGADRDDDAAGLRCVADGVAEQVAQRPHQLRGGADGEGSFGPPVDGRP